MIDSMSQVVTMGALPDHFGAVTLAFLALLCANHARVAASLAGTLIAATASIRDAITETLEIHEARRSTAKAMRATASLPRHSTAKRTQATSAS
jgi:hypothetical protein